MAQHIAGDVCYLANFALRQWDDPNYSGTQLTCSKQELVEQVHKALQSGTTLVDGYAPFCKHIFIPNFAGAKGGSVPVTPDNEHLVRTGYVSRRPEELAVLSRWIPRGAVEQPDARFLDIIMYSREQIQLEKAALPEEGDAPQEPDVPWGIISIKAQDEDFETPMQPITMMRNALGREEGGSGVPLDKEKYAAAVKYWQARVTIS